MAFSISERIKPPKGDLDVEFMIGSCKVLIFELNLVLSMIAKFCPNHIHYTLKIG